jgi:acetate kinase
LRTLFSDPMHRFKDGYQRIQENTEMKVLVINSGSSSLKYKLFDMTDARATCAGIVERIGSPNARLTHTLNPDTAAEKKIRLDRTFDTHTEAIETVATLLMEGDHPPIQSVDDLKAIGHRVAQGGETFKENCIIDEKVIDGIRENIALAPLHNPANLAGIEAARERFPDVPSVAVFDTQFSKDLPDYAFRYAIPKSFYTDFKVRRYGFHGTSHRFVTRQLARLMKTPVEALNNIVCHLGNGSSMTAVKGGICRETSMGMTPTAGLIMGTRCGDIDPALPSYLTACTGKSVNAIQAILDRESGLTGICGLNDMRDIHSAMAAGDDDARLAFEMLCYNIRKYIGAYFTVLGRLDAVAFTAGIGENDPAVRAKSLEGLETMGIVIDREANAALNGRAGRISAPDSQVQVWVVPTNEELEIVYACRDLLPSCDTLVA